MSWSIAKTAGKPDKVRDAVTVEFDRSAAAYAGKTEEQDVLSAKQAVLAWIAEAACTDTEGVQCEASGSRGQGWVNITVNCVKIRLLV